MFVKGKQYFLQDEHQITDDKLYISCTFIYELFLLYGKVDYENFVHILIHYGYDWHFRSQSNTSVVKSPSALAHWLAHRPALSIFPSTNKWQTTTGTNHGFI